MKVCFLTDDPSDLGGGPEHMLHVALILRQKYHCSVDVLTPTSTIPNFDLTNLGHRIRFALWILKFLLSSDYDIYHSHSYATSLFLPVVKLQGKKAGITVHGLGVDFISGGFLNKTGIPKFLMHLVLNLWPFDFRLSAASLKGFTTVGNGVDIAEFAKVKPKTSGVFTILCISRPDPVKGIDILQGAINRLSQKGYKLRLNFVSGRRRTIKDFETSDVYVLPSLSEGLPVVLLEAMAAKLPIIATDVGDCRQIVEQSKSGIVVPPGDGKSLEKAILEMKSRKDRRKLGLNGHEYVKKNYTWEKVAQHTYETYQQIYQK